MLFNFLLLVLMLSGNIQKAFWNFEDPSFVIMKISDSLPVQHTSLLPLLPYH